jgi:hypothetical protein
VGLVTSGVPGGAGVGLPGWAPARPDGDGDTAPLGDGETESVAAERPPSSAGIGAGGWTSPPTPPITVSASMLTATDATAPTVHAAAPVDTRRSAELTGTPSHDP